MWVKLPIVLINEFMSTEETNFLNSKIFANIHKKKKAVWFVVWVLWHINLCRKPNPFFIQINSSISNNSVQQKYTV